MVTRAQVDKPLAVSPVTVMPALPGEAKWLDERTLVVWPTSPLPVSTTFTVTVPAHIKALDGNELDDPLTYEFSTERLTASLDVLGTADHATADQTVRLSFNQRVPLANVIAHCHFTATGARQVAVKNGPQSPSGPAQNYMLVPAAPLAMDSAWRVACEAGLMGSVGTLGLAYEVVLPFHTFGAMKFVKFQQAGKDIVPDEGSRLSLVFTNPLKQPYQMKLEPAAAGFPQTCHALDEAAPGVTCMVGLDPQTTYTLTVDAKQTDTAGQALGKTEVVTFHTSDAPPMLSMDSGYFIAELKRPVLPVWARNVKTVVATAVQVTPENFHDLRPLIDWWAPKPADLTKTKLQPKTLKLAMTGDKNKWSQHPLGAAELFGGTPGPGMFYLELGSPDVTEAPFEDGGVKKVLVNFTDIGVVSKLSGARGLVWATRLSTGKALPGATVTVRDGSGKVTWSGTTDADGVAVLPGTGQLAGKAAPVAKSDGLDPDGEHYEEERGGAGAGGGGGIRIFVSQGADWTMINPSRTNGLAAWNFNVSVDNSSAAVKLRGFMHTDRGLYRPGEKVHVKGLARVTKLGSPLDVPGEGKKAKVTVDGPNGKRIIETEAKVSAYGGFWFDVDLPGDARLGDYSIHATLDSGTFYRAFTVEEYRPATFEVTGEVKTAMVVHDGAIQGTVAASYFYGAPVRGGKVALTVHSRSRWLQFKGYDDFEFSDQRRYDGYHDESREGQSLVTEDHAPLDDKGNAPIAIAIGPNEVTSDVDLLVQATVTAPNNEAINKSFTVPYYRARTYFGIKAPGYFLDVGKPQKFVIAAVTPEGKPASGDAKVIVNRRDWNCVWEDWGYRGNYQCKEISIPVLEKAISLAGKPVDFEFTAVEDGEYWVAVEGSAPDAASASRHLYAWGGEGGSWKSTDTMALEIVADKKAYKIGDTAILILKTDLAEATGLVTIERDGVIEKRTIALSKKMKHVEVPITANYAPNVYVSVALVQGRIGDGPRGKPRMRMGIIDLSVRPEDNKLTVTVDSDKKDYRPGEEVTATVKVLGADGKPVSAEVSITAADEGVLSLIGYETPDPIPTFYAAWGLGVTTATQLEYIRDIPGANQERPALGGDAVGTMRSRFVSTAVWTPGAITDANGLATVKFAAPDNLTAFRMMALAADRGHRFGSADKRFTVSKPLQLHEALPRFANTGDAFSGGVVIHNETGRAGTATVKLVADAHVVLGGNAERTVPVAKDASVPVWYALTAAVPGEATLKFTVTMDGDGDGVEFKLPVRHPSPVRSDRVTAGVATAPMKIAVPLPAHAIPGTAEVEISVDPDGLSGIENGLADLIHYPYGCLEQTTSKLIPMIAARDLAESLAIDGLTGPALESYVKAGITKIGKHQTTYGGFSLWPGGEPETYYTAYALWGLYLARQAGYPVDGARIDDALAYLKNDGASGSASRPHSFESGDLGSQAFALYIRTVLADKAAQGSAAAMLGKMGVMPIYGKAFLARALAVGLGATDKEVGKLVAELASFASAAVAVDKLIAEPREKELWSYMSSSPRTTAAVLAALVELDPKNAVIKPLVATIMRHRHTGALYDTQSNLYELVALSAYAKTVTGAPPSVTVELGGKAILTGALAGKQRIRVASAPLPAAGELQLTPTGEVHYHVEVRYRKAVDALVAESHGLVIAHEYLDEAGKPMTKFRVGDVVRVKLTTTLAVDSDHLMVSDALPAGFEPLNTRFKTVGDVGVLQTTEWGTFQEMHDDRVDFASEYSSYGEYVHEFQVRATTAGKFIRPPTMASLMYQPEVTAQTAAQPIVIEAR